MALHVNRQNNRTELQERLAAELREKQKRKAEMEDNDRPDGVDDSAYMKNQKKTTSLAWVWALITIFSIGLIFYVAVATT